MGLLSGVGRGLQGLFGDGDFADTMAQAQAYLDGNYLEAARFGDNAARRRRPAPKPGQAGGKDIGGKALTIPPVGSIVDGHRYMDGDPTQDSSWRPLDGARGGVATDPSYGFGGY